MNQILYTTNQKKKGEPLDIKVVLRIFAITCIIFGIILIGTATYSIINNNEEELSSSEPLVQVYQEGETLKVSIKHDKIIDKITYSWTQNQEIILQGKGRTQLEEQIKIPTGVNTLVLKVTDISGKVVSYSEQYYLPEGDVIKPEIELLVESSKVKIVAKDETELDYILYYWNNEDETRINTREDSIKQIEEKIDIIKGENTLTIIAVDKAGNEQLKEQVFKAVKKPKIEMSRNEDKLIITVTDEEALQKIEYTLNGVEYSTDPQNTGTPLNRKELVIPQPLEQGENKITIKAYNISGLQAETSAEVTL